MVEFMISVFCTQTTLGEPKYTEACKYSLNATSIELSIKEEAQKFERKIERRVVDRTGRVVWIYAGIAHHFIQTNEIMYVMPGYPVVDSMALKANNTFSSVNLTLSWSF